MYRFLQNNFNVINQPPTGSPDTSASALHNLPVNGSFHSPLCRSQSSKDVNAPPSMYKSAVNIPGNSSLKRSQSTSTLGTMPKSLPECTWDEFRDKESREKERREKSFYNRSMTITLPNNMDLTRYLSDELEPLADYVTDMSYKSIRSSDTHLTRIGPTVAECTAELEEEAASALAEIKELAEHNEALDTARYLEGCRKQKQRYAVKFLQSNYDLSMEILNLRSRYLSIKFAFLNGMIERLAHLRADSVAPSYLTMTTFTDWVGHSAIIDDIQDKMLRVRTKKVRLKRNFLSAFFKDKGIFQDFDMGMDRFDKDNMRGISIRLQSVTQEMCFMKGDIDCIHRQLAHILSENRSEDEGGLDVLRSLLGDPTSFENRKMDEYVKECMECESVEKDRVWDSILVFEDGQPEPFAESIPGANPSRYQEYVSAMTLYICDKLRHAAVPTDNIAVFATLEQRIMPRIYTLAMLTVAKAGIDAVIQAKCRRIKGYTQDQIGIPEAFISLESMPYFRAIARFKSLVFSMTPSNIMQTITSAANDIHQKMKEVCPDQAVGADAFFPVWVYCIVKSNLPNLATLVNFLKGYLNPSLRYCEIGYYVTCLEGACVYIQELREVDFYSDNRYFVFDKERYKSSQIAGKGIFSYLHDRTLTGYKLFVGTDYLTQAHRFYKCALLYTGNEDDHVLGGVISPGPAVSNVQVEHFERLMTSPGHYVITDVGNGVLSVAVMSEEQDSHTTPMKSHTTSKWMEIKEGDFTSIKNRMSLVISLYRCGIWTLEERAGLLEKIADGSIDALPESAYARIAIQYGFYLKSESEVLTFLKEVQLLLRYLNCLSVFVDVDGVISELTVSAIRNFQLKHNQSGEYVEKLSETGTLTRDTYNRLRGTLKALLIDLQKLGYHLHCNPLLKENVDKMTQFIKDIQEDCRLGVYVKGRFCDKTRSTIRRLLYENAVAAWYHPHTTVVANPLVT